MDCEIPLEKYEQSFVNLKDSERRTGFVKFCISKTEKGYFFYASYPENYKCRRGAFHESMNYVGEEVDTREKLIILCKEILDKNKYITCSFQPPKKVNEYAPDDFVKIFRNMRNTHNQNVPKRKL